jgi:hypothetical protein
MGILNRSIGVYAIQKHSETEKKIVHSLNGLGDNLLNCDRL